MPLCAIEGTQMMFDIAPLRAAIKLDKAAKTVACDASASAFKPVVAASVEAANTVSVLSCLRTWPKHA
jgi:hypothetical protein